MNNNEVVLQDFFFQTQPKMIQKLSSNWFIFLQYVQKKRDQKSIHISPYNNKLRRSHSFKLNKGAGSSYIIAIIIPRYLEIKRNLWRGDFQTDRWYFG